MSIEPVGLLTLIVGVLCLQLGYRGAAAILVVAALLGAAAAILVGTANIQPAHLLLGFVAWSTLTRRHEMNLAARAVAFPEPGFWLLCLVIYCLFSAFLMPRLLAGSMPIIPLGTSEYADNGSTVPLSPTSGNVTQSIYMVGDLACFVMIVAIASTQSGFATIANALIAYAAGNVLFALIDLATYSTGTAWLLDFIRNAQYQLHIEEEVYGLKRIVGSFTEASVFARTTLGALGFTGTLWLCRRQPALTGALALASFVLVVLSTSSTGLAGTPPVLLILYVTAWQRVGIELRRPISSAAVICAPFAIIAIVLAALLNDEAARPVREYVDALILSKAGTGSGIERSSWNYFAWQNFLDSYGLGVGLGTVRTSSLPVALVSNVGIPGTAFYLLFAISAFAGKRGEPRTYTSDVRLAARNACLGLIIGDSLVGSVVEQGLLFFILAGIACATPERSAAPLIPSLGHRVEKRI